MNKREWPGCLKNPAQRELMRRIARLARRAKPITIPDLEWELKRRNQTLHAQTQRLEEEGYIEIIGAPHERKELRFTELGREWVRVMGARVFGEVTAGEPRECLESDGRDASWEEVFHDSYDDVLPPTEEFGKFVVSSDSMIGDGILPGDWVHVELGVRLGDLDDGEKAVVMVGEDFKSTLKHIHYDRESAMVTLRASNPAYPDRTVPAHEVRVVGAYYGRVHVEPKRQRRGRN